MEVLQLMHLRDCGRKWQENEREGRNIGRGEGKAEGRFG